MVAHHAVMPPAVPGALPSGGACERGVGLEAWRVVCGRLEGRRPSHGERDVRPWLIVPVGATAVPLGWAVGVVCGAQDSGHAAVFGCSGVGRIRAGAGNVAMVKL